MFSRYLTIAALFAAISHGVQAERHVVHFENKCGRGTPLLIQGPNILSHGEDYVSTGPLRSAIAYLQTGQCSFDGNSCTLVETTLVNPQCAGCGSSTDISLIPDHKFSVKTGFRYRNGCDGAGATCDNPDCPTAFHKPTDTHVQVACQVNDVDLVITFC